MENSRFHNRRGWVLGPWADPLYFLGPVLVALVPWLLFGRSAPQYAAFMVAGLFVKNFVDMSHVCSTLFIGVRRRAEGRISRLVFYGGPALVLAGGSALYAASPMLFFAGLAYASVFHFYRQQHGWLMLSRARAAEPASTRWIDTLFMLNLIQYPVVFWHSPESRIELSYLNPGDMLLRAPAALAAASCWLFWAANAAYLLWICAEAARGRVISAGKALLLGSTFALFYGGLVLANDFSFWWFTAAIVHGGPYLHLVYRESFPAAARRAAPALAFTAAALGLALWWEYGPKFESYAPAFVTAQLFPLFWLPTLLHYFFDAFVWLREKRAPAASIAAAEQRAA